MGLPHVPIDPCSFCLNERSTMHSSSLPLFPLTRVLGIADPLKPCFTDLYPVKYYATKGNIIWIVPVQTVFEFSFLGHLGNSVIACILQSLSWWQLVRIEKLDANVLIREMGLKHLHLPLHLIILPCEVPINAHVGLNPFHYLSEICSHSLPTVWQTY